MSHASKLFQHLAKGIIMSKEIKEAIQPVLKAIRLRNSGYGAAMVVQELMKINIEKLNVLLDEKPKTKEPSQKVTKKTAKKATK